MGADLYIQPIYERQRSRYAPRFEHSVRVRDQATTADAHAHAQLQVERYFDRMYAKGYFRDSYNDTNLLVKFDLSWWADVLPRLDAEGGLVPDAVRWLMATLKAREPVFRARIAADPHWRYFVEKYRELRAFLRTALTRDEPVSCSL